VTSKMETSQGEQGSGRRVTLVTGATGGLGKAVAAEFLAQGHLVWATYRKEEDAQALRAELASDTGEDALRLERADVTDSAAVERLVSTIDERDGRLDHLVNLVGGYAGGPSVWETAPEELDRMLQLNLRSAFLCCRAALPGMVARRYGRVVNVSSRTAVQPSRGHAPYAIAKMGVVTLTETLALELRDHGDVTANCVLPSVIDTPANREAMPKADPARWVSAAQLAAVIRWLTSEEAAPINGAAIPVYGKA
jgi:NAD(P)-dependent dehydrogenase (short-subunit alcohol dehydrogenase family)